MSSDDAQAVVSLLQDEGVDYRYNDKNGSVQVMSDTVDKTRAELLSKGYPKSGFTYDMYRNNAGIMSTEKDKEKYTLYELQDRLGAQIGLFEGVRDAKVTIAEGGTQKYALDDAQQTDASASVVVTMNPGQDLTDTKAAAIKNLIARAVKGMNFTNVSVFEAATMMEVGGEDEAGNTAGYRKRCSRAYQSGRKKYSRKCAPGPGINVWTGKSCSFCKRHTEYAEADPGNSPVYHSG